MRIVVRSREMRFMYVAKKMSAIAARTNRVGGLERVDIWRGSDGGAQVGLSWRDGSGTIFDHPHLVDAIEWFASRRRRCLSEWSRDDPARERHEGFGALYPEVTLHWPG